MSNLAKVPFLDSAKYPFTLLYDDGGGFLIASGEDKDFQGHISIGVRWERSRSEKDDKEKFVGFPSIRGGIGCWLILPDELALCLLRFVVGKAKTNNGAIIKAIQEIEK